MARQAIARTRGARVLAGLVATISIGGCSPAAPAPTPAPGPVSVHDNPLAGLHLYVDPTTAAADQVARWQAQGRTADADQIGKIAWRPGAHWLTSASPEVFDSVRRLVEQAEAANEVPVLAAYFIPHRDCGQFSAGGASSAQAYREWIRAIARAIGGHPALVIVEPDAIAHTLAGCGSAPAERYPLLADAVSVLKGQTAARVYLDAGHPDWADTPALADALRRSGIAKADGFALNVANFLTTEDNLAYGQHVSDDLGGAHFVIDTSRNGAGPGPSGDINGGPGWCNPPDRQLGQAPTTTTGLPRVDGLLWVKRPGESDGACRPGEPPAGQWWPEYALALAQRSP